MSQSIVNLIARLEKATSPDRELDAEIAALIAEAECEIQPNGQPAYHRGGSWVSIGPVLAYTASLDAALTLVPAKLWLTMTIIPEKTCANVKTGSLIDPKTKEWSGVAPKPAIALCIAALKARARSNHD